MLRDLWPGCSLRRRREKHDHALVAEYCGRYIVWWQKSEPWRRRNLLKRIERNKYLALPGRRKGPVAPWVLASNTSKSSSR